MALTDNKITTYQNSIADLPDKPSDAGYTAEQLKAMFDARTDNEVKEKLNGLIDDLTALGIEEAVVSEGIRQIRVNADGVIEVSSDGMIWTATASSGHIILDKNGNALTQRSRMQFTNCNVLDNGTATVVEGVQGPKGYTGATGAQGPQGAQGPKGDTGPVIVPEIDLNGVMSFTLQNTAIVPNPVSVR